MTTATDAMQELQRQFAASLPARMEALRTQYQKVSLGKWQADEVESLHQLLHGLTGAAGAFGFQPVSAAARQLGNRLLTMIHSETAPDGAAWQGVDAELDRIEQLVQSGLHADAPSLSVPADIPRLKHAPLVYLVEDDARQAEHLGQILRDEGYRVRVLPSATEFQSAFRGKDAEFPDAVVFDMILPDGRDAGAELLAKLKADKKRCPPAVFVSVRDDMQARLSAFRAGASRYLTKPLESGRLLGMLDALIGRQPPQPYRVLMVDCDPLLLEAHAAMLQAAGMEVRTLSQPLHILDALNGFDPDVVVLDVYMPEASGPELAAVLRERDGYLNLPILFLSAEADLSKQLLALNLGGDDFLVKPVQAEYLVAAVAARARRNRQNAVLYRRLQTTLYEREREHLALDHHAMVSVADKAGAVTYVNDKFCEISGYTRGELLGKNHRIVQSGYHPPEFYQSLWRTVSSGSVWQGEICNRRKDGSLYWVASTITPFLDADGVPYQYVAMRTDITETKAAEAAQRAQNAMRQVVNEVAGALLAAGAETLDATIERCLQRAGKHLGADRAYLWLLNGDGEHLRNSHEWCATGIASQKDELQAFPLQAIGWWWAQMEHGEMVHISDVAAMPPEAAAEKAMFERLELRAVCGFPLQRAGQTVGLIGFDQVTGTRAWEQEALDLLGLLADQIESALQRAAGERTLREQQRFTKNILDSVAGNIAVLDSQGVIIAVNKNWRRYAEKNAPEGDQPVRNTDLGTNYLEVCRQGCRAGIQYAQVALEGIEAVVTGRAPHFSFEYPCHAPTEADWFVMSVSPMSSDRGGVVVVHTRVTERKLAEQARAASANRLNATLESTKDGILAVTAGGEVLFMNRPFRQMWNMPDNLVRNGSDEQLLAYALPQLLDPQGFMKKVQALYQSTDESEDLIELLDGRVFERHSKPLRCEGQTVGRVWSFHDITERLRAEQAADAATERLRRGQMYANLGTWEWNIVTGDLFWTERIAALFGYPAGDRATSYDNFLAAVHPHDRQAVIDAVDACIEHDAPYDIEHRVVWPDGTVRWLLERGAVVRDAEGKPLSMIGVVQDIDDRKRAERELLVFRRVFDATEQGIGVTDAEGYLLYSNPAHDRLLGYQPPECQGMHFTQFLTEEAMQWAPKLVMSVVAGGESWAGLLPVKRKDDTEFITASNVGFIAGSEGRPDLMFNIMSDYTSELQRQQQLSNAKEAADRANQAKSAFLSSMSHELRTPMNAILGFAQILEYDGGLDAEHQDSVREILRAGHHLLELINEVLDLARVEAGRLELSLEPVEIGPVVEECVGLIQPLAQKRAIRIRHQGLARVWARADHTRLKQVLLNLLSNAVKYNREGGEVRLDIVAHEADRLRILVNDTGKGVAPEQLDGLFQPFNRLGAEGSAVEGTGIGLTITRRIMEMMGGSVDVESEVGVGSTFWVELPLAPQGEKAGTSAQHGEGEHAPAGQQQLVLYIEDNPANLKLVARLLGRLPDIHLVTARLPELGLELARARKPALILLDISLPGMDGFEALRRLREDPATREIPVIAITAHAMARDIERGKQAGFADYITKPLQVGAFLDSVLHWLGQKSNPEA